MHWVLLSETSGFSFPSENIWCSPCTNAVWLQILFVGKKRGKSLSALHNFLLKLWYVCVILARKVHLSFAIAVKICNSTDPKCLLFVFEHLIFPSPSHFHCWRSHTCFVDYNFHSFFLLQTTHKAILSDWHRASDFIP